MLNNRIIFYNSNFYRPVVLTCGHFRIATNTGVAFQFSLDASRIDKAEVLIQLNFL